jgi:hypothetical protein
VPDETQIAANAATQAVEEARKEVAAAETAFVRVPDPDPAPSHAELFERAREAVEALRGGQRDAKGRILPGAMLALKHGRDSGKLIEQADIAAWHREQVEAISADLGGANQLTALQAASVREVARLEVILCALGTELLTGGVLTGKGKMRACTTVYLSVLDRFTRLCSALGLERRARKVASLTEAMNGE